MCRSLSAPSHLAPSSLTTSYDLRVLTRHQGALYTEHLTGDHSAEAVDLARVLFDLPSDEHSLEPARLVRQLEQFLPLILRQKRLLLLLAEDVLCFPLLLPSLDLRLLAAQRSLVVRRVVLFLVVRFDGVEKEVGGLLQEWIDGEIQSVVVWCERVGRETGLGVVTELSEGCWEVGSLLLRWWGGKLVQERGEEVGVVDRDGELDEDILVAQVALLQAVIVVSRYLAISQISTCSIPLRCELVLLERCHKRRA